MVNKPETKTDRRVLYTKMFLKESLLELMKEKPVDKITPTELCRHANINRNTFYTHYYSVRDVLEELELEFSNQIVESLSTRFSASEYDVMLQEICRIIYDRRDFCKILLSENGDTAFFNNVIGLGKPFVVAQWRDAGIDLPDEDMEMFFSFIVNGSVAIIRMWAASDMKQTPEYIAQLIRITAYGGIDGMINSKK